MNDAAWERLVDAIDVGAGITSHAKKTEPLEDHPELNHTIESFEFEKSGQKFKLERTTGPAIIDRKTHYSSRPGVANRIENIYDPEESASQVKLLKLEGGEWSEVDISNLQL